MSEIRCNVAVHEGHLIYDYFAPFCIQDAPNSAAFIAYEYEGDKRSVLPAAYRRVVEGDLVGDLLTTPGRMEGVEYKLVRPVAVVFRGGE